ncbi:MAG: hypothetical protein ABI119_03340 [Gemmatimonadaceae bacterium]
MSFDESKHPRSKNGEFASKGGGGGKYGSLRHSGGADAMVPFDQMKPGAHRGILSPGSPAQIAAHNKIGHAGVHKPFGMNIINAGSTRSAATAGDEPSAAEKRAAAKQFGSIGHTITDHKGRVLSSGSTPLNGPLHVRMLRHSKIGTSGRVHHKKR